MNVTTTDWKVIDDVRTTMLREWLEVRGYGYVMDCTPSASPYKHTFSKTGQSFSIERHSNFGRPTFEIGKGAPIGGGEWAWVKIAGVSEERLKESLADLEKRLDSMLKASKTV